MVYNSPFSKKEVIAPMPMGAGMAKGIGGGARALAKSQALKDFNKRILNTVKPRARASIIKARDAMKNI